MMSLVDGCVLLELLKHKPSEKFLHWAESLKKIQISAITLEEFETAIARRVPNKRREASLWASKFMANHCEVLSVTHEVAALAAQLRIHSGHQGKHLSAVDAIVAATTKAHGLELITANPRNYSECGLTIHSLL